MIRHVRFIVGQLSLFSAYGLSFGLRLIYARYLFWRTNKTTFRLQEFRLIKSFLDKEFGHVLDLFPAHDEIGLISPDYPVWVFWWQGEDQAPELTQVCIRSIKKYSSNHEVRIMTRNNIRAFVELPDFIYQKVDEGKMTLTHFSDVLRMALLYQHGGLWMDATLFITRDFFGEIVGRPLYTNRIEGKVDHSFVSEYQWSSFLLGGAKGNPLFGSVLSLLLEYWRTRNSLVDFYLFDFFIALARDKIPSVRAMIDGLEPNNPDIHSLHGMLRQAYDPCLMNDLMKRTYVFKLTWKKRFEEHIDGELTFFGWLVNDSLKNRVGLSDIEPDLGVH